MFRILRKAITVLLLSACIPLRMLAQDVKSDSLLTDATLERVIQYTLQHQPLVQQSLIDQEVIDKTIKGKLADWYPQINFVYNYQHFFDLQTSIIADQPIRFGVLNTSAIQLNATQSLFNRDILLASSTASNVREQAKQNTGSKKIDAVINTTKAFYDVLATTQQIKVSEEVIVRQEQNLKNTFSQYTAGLTDKTDYKRATISLSNAKAALKSNKELLKYKLEYLKSVMGYPLQGDLDIQYDTLQMEREIGVDTLQQIDYVNRIEYKQLTSQKILQEANVKYSYWGFIPTLSAFGSYILNYQNDNLSDLYATRYPYSYVVATFTFPILQGGKRTLKIQEQKWSLRRIDWELVNLKNGLNAEYTRALSSYKSNLATYLALKDNVALAEEVYDIIQLRYKNGVKTYLEVITAEADLRTARINYFNALYLVLASKVDMQKALGQIDY